MGSKFAAGIAVGIGLKWLSPYFVPVLGTLLRPLTRIDVKPIAKAGIKVSWLGLARGREWVAHFGETVQDAIAEARAEVAREANQPLDKS